MDNLFSYVLKGGYLMIPIGLCSVIALTVVIERFVRLKRNKIIPPDFLLEIKSLLKKNMVLEVMTYCENSEESISRIIKAGIDKINRSRAEIKETIEMAGRQEMLVLEKNLGILATIASISPLLGLLGTVTGMIRVFHVISIQGVGDPAALSAGISEALITTAAGLVVGIPTLVAYNYFMKRSNRILIEMEKASQEILDILSRRPGENENEF